MSVPQCSYCLDSGGCPYCLAAGRLEHPTDGFETCTHCDGTGRCPSCSAPLARSTLGG